MNVTEAEATANYDLYMALGQDGNKLQAALKEQSPMYDLEKNNFAHTLNNYGGNAENTTLGREWEEYGLWEEYLKEYAGKLAAGEAVHELPKPYEVWLASQQQFLAELNDDNGEWHVGAPLVLRYPIAVNYAMMGKRKSVASEASITFVEADEVHLECMSRVARGRVELARAKKEYVPSEELVSRVQEGEDYWKNALKFGSKEIDPKKPIIYICDVNFDAYREDNKAKTETAVAMEEAWNTKALTRDDANFLNRYYAGGVVAGPNTMKPDVFKAQFHDGRLHLRYWQANQYADICDLGMWNFGAAEFAAANNITYIFPKPYAYDKGLMEAYGIQLVDCTEEVWKIVDAYIWRKDKNGVPQLGTPDIAATKAGIDNLEKRGKIGFNVSNMSQKIMWLLKNPREDGPQNALSSPVIDGSGRFMTGGHAAAFRKRSYRDVPDALYLLDSVENPRITLINGNDLEGKGLGENTFLKLAVEKGLGKEILKRHDKGEKPERLVKWINRKCKFDDDRMGSMMLEWLLENRAGFAGE